MTFYRSRISCYGFLLENEYNNYLPYVGFFPKSGLVFCYLYGIENDKNIDFLISIFELHLLVTK